LPQISRRIELRYWYDLQELVKQNPNLPTSGMLKRPEVNVIEDVEQ